MLNFVFLLLKDLTEALKAYRNVANTSAAHLLQAAANLQDTDYAIETAKTNGNDKIIILHCTSAYPTPISESNLSTINEIGRLFNVQTGLSDHTLGTEVASYACVLGASFIEKHFTLDRKKGGVDSKFSLNPNEFKKLVDESKKVKSIIGKPAFGPTRSEASSLIGRRSLYVVNKIRKGQEFSRKNLKSIRPGNGLKPKLIKAVLGLKASRDIDFGEPLDLSMIENYLK